MISASPLAASWRRLRHPGDASSTAFLERDVAEEREHLGLLAHRDALVVLLLPFEVAERGLAERADRGEARRVELLGFGEAREAGDRVLARVEDHGVHTVLPIDELRLHRAGRRNKRAPAVPV